MHCSSIELAMLPYAPFTHALQPWTYLDITLRSCMGQPKCLNLNSMARTCCILQYHTWINAKMLASVDDIPLPKPNRISILEKASGEGNALLCVSCVKGQLQTMSWPDSLDIVQSSYVKANDNFFCAPVLVDQKQHIIMQQIPSLHHC